ncbi:MAG: ribbon-helix-helix protein, CopG family [Candidatus Bathyarchaeia archaeon]|jgi:CopG family nickel-responsive transcriptional regulator
MAIVSLSFPDEMVKDMDQLQKSRGFTGRSELVRAALRLMMEDTREKDSFVGNIDAVLAVTHREEDEEPVTSLKHSFQEIVRTHIHNKINRGNCVDLFLLEGEGKIVASMIKAFQDQEDMKSVKLIVL